VDLLAFLGLKASRETPVRKGLPDHKEPPATKVHKDRWGLQELTEPMEHQALRDLKGFLEM
jgi:hypothetical protein